MVAVTRVLVTGADGFIGSNLTESLVREGYEVRALVQYNSFNSWGWLDKSPPDISAAVDVVAGDVRDPHGIHHVVKGCDAILHLAALVAIPYSYVSPDAYIDTNVKGTLNVLQAARNLDIAKVVHTSTSEVYGTARYVPIDEAHPLQGQSPYSASKIAADQLAASFSASYDLPIVTLRPFNTYGPRQSARAVIPTVISQIAAGNELVKLGAVSPTRDFTFISDTVSGFVAALESDSAVGQVINLGAGFEVSIEKTATLIAEIMNASLSIVCDEPRLRPENSEVDRLLSDNSKAKRMLNWSPSFVGLDGFREGLRRTVEWFTSPENLGNYKADVYNI